ncbi:MAG: hypothetical protein ABIO45_18155 [Burkholderiaceae bacterium]
MTTPDPAPTCKQLPTPAVEVVLTDYADLGTAFGLDASVAHGSAASVAPATTAHPKLPWEHRLTRRSGL